MRTLEHDVSGLTASNPYTGTTQKITNYIADPAEMAILHMVNADLARTPTFALFARPDYFLSPGAANCSTACVSVNSGFAYNHGDFAAEINTKHLGLAGPGVKHLGPGRPGAWRRPELRRAEQRAGAFRRRRRRTDAGRCQAGRSCWSMYWRRTVMGAPPADPAK